MNTSVFVSAGIAGGVLLTCAALHITYLGMRAKRERSNASAGTIPVVDSSDC